MKIAILTFHTPINYGAILQTYALQKFLKNSFPEANVKIIDFKTDIHIKKYNIFLPFRRNIILYALHQLCILLRYAQLKERKKKFTTFQTTEFSLTKRFHSQDELLNQIPLMDYYIVGSDQVFHPKSLYIRTYFLDFQKKTAKKIAYAPSFGMSDFNKEIEEKIHPFLQDFDSLSCREKDGAEFMSKSLNREIPVVLDPIFLLSCKEWDKITKYPEENEKYIFIYDLNGGKNLIKIAKEIKKITGLKIICQTQTAHNFYAIDKQIYHAGPEEFIGYIINAEYIVTDSFHGTAFSVLFNKKQFVYIARPCASTRIRSIMNLLDLTGNIVENNKANLFHYREPQKIKEQSVLNRLIEKSKSYLIKSLP
jgi:hypothetical protein